MAGPVETKRRHWPWLVLAALLLVVAGPRLWRFRPLNATEKSLVGRWQSTRDGPIYTFRADRSYECSFIFDSWGTWTAANGEISFQYPLSFPSPRGQSWLGRFKTFYSQLHPTRVTFNLHGPDLLLMVGNSYARLPDRLLYADQPADSPD